MQLYIGIHGGAQRSTAVALDLDTLQCRIAKGDGFPFHQMDFPHDEIWRRFTTLMSDIARQFGFGNPDEMLPSCKDIVIALPGAFGDEFREIANHIFDRNAWSSVTQHRSNGCVIDDTEAVLFSGPAETGVALVCGTGTAVYARNADGKDVKVDGWGPLLGDDGSAFDIGLRGLRAVVRAGDKRGPECPVLTELVLEKLSRDLGGQSVDTFDLIPWMSDCLGHHELARLGNHEKGAIRNRIASFATIVDSAATRGDSQALAVFDDCAEELVRSVTTAVNEVVLGADFCLFYEGGAIEGSGDYLRRFLGRLHEAFPKASPRAARFRISIGALIAALCKDRSINSISVDEPLLSVLSDLQFDNSSSQARIHYGVQ